MPRFGGGRGRRPFSGGATRRSLTSRPAAIFSPVHAGFREFLGWLHRMRRWWIVGPVLLIVLLTFHSFRHLLSELRYGDVIAAIQSTSLGQVGWAVLATGLSFLALTGYDRSALQYAGAPVPYRLSAPTSFVAFALSNSIGLSVLTGGAVRLRMYGAAGVTPAVAARVIAFNTLAFGVGTAFSGAVALLWGADRVAPALHMSPLLLRTLAAALLAAVLVGLVFCARGQHVPLPRLRTLRLPTLDVALKQLFYSALDIAAAGAALWFLLPEGAVSLPVFLGFYTIGIAAGVVSHVPGGLGVFEAVMLVALGAHIPGDQLAGALILYRLVYYVLPMACALVLLSTYEMRRGVAAPLVRALGQVSPLLLAAFTIVVGVMLLVSGVTPATDEATALLELHVPLPVVEAAHFLGSIAGLAMLIIARGMIARLDAAWWAGTVIAGVSLLLALPKGIAISEAGVLFFEFVVLLLSRRHFTRRASLLSGAFEVGWWIPVFAVLGAVFALFFFVYRDVAFSQELWWQFAFDAHAPRSLRAMVAVTIVALAIAVGRLFRPPAPRLALPGPVELERAQAIIQRQPAADAALALMGDKSLMFSASGESFLMFARQGRSWVGLFDPVGRVDEQAELVWALLERARDGGGRASFYQVRSSSLSIYLDSGLRVFKLGEHAFVPLADFSLQGSRRAGLRQGLKRAEREGLTFEIIAPADVPARLPELRRISDAWLGAQRTAEKGFSLGAFDDRYVSRGAVAVALKDGHGVAFASLIGTERKVEASVDLMRQVPDAPKSAMEFLLTHLMLHFREAGFQRFGLGMAPLSGMAEHPLASRWHRLGRLVFAHGEYFYNFQGLRAFKEKFDPVWEPRYLAAPGGVAPLLVLADIAILISGGVRAAVSR